MDGYKERLIVEPKLPGMEQVTANDSWLTGYEMGYRQALLDFREHLQGQLNYD